MTDTPRTVVPAGIADPVESARAELKAALAAIEEKANVPKRVARATEREVSKARTFASERPVAATVAAVGVAVTVGAAVWGLVRMYLR
jgi:hypothetical protein